MISQSLRAVLYFFVIIVISLYFLESYFINNQFYEISIKNKTGVVQTNYQNIIKVVYQFLENADYEPDKLNIKRLKTIYPSFRDFIAWNINWIPLDVKEKVGKVSASNTPRFLIWDENYFALTISLEQFQKPYFAVFLLDKEKFQSKQSNFEETYYPITLKGKKVNPYFIKSKVDLFERFLPTEISSSNFMSRIISPSFFGYYYSNFSFYNFLILNNQTNNFIFYALLSLLFLAMILADLLILILKSFWVKGFVYGEILKDTFENENFDLTKKHASQKLYEKKLFEEEFKSFDFGENKLKIGQGGSYFDIILPPELISQSYITPSKLEDFLQPRIPEEINKKRNAIFNPELMNLIQNVTSPKSTPNTEKLEVISTVNPKEKEEKDDYPLFWKEKENKFLKFLENLEPSEKAQLEKILDNVYDSKMSLKSGMEQFFKIILEKQRVQKFCLNLHKKNIGYYYPILFSNINEYTSKNFIFSLNDEFLDFGKKDISIIELTDKLKSEPFFSKKFHPSDFENITCIASFIIFANYRLFLFFLEKIEEEEIENLKQNLEIGLYPIYPFLYKKNQEQNKLEIKNQYPQNYTLQEFNYLKYATQGGKQLIYVCTINFSKDIKYSQLQSLNLKISMDLEDGELVYNKSYNSICILSKFQPDKIIKKFIQPLGIEYETDINRYPDQSNNYFMYF